MIFFSIVPILEIKLKNYAQRSSSSLEGLKDQLLTKKWRHHFSFESNNSFEIEIYYCKRKKIMQQLSALWIIHWSVFSLVILDTKAIFRTLRTILSWIIYCCNWPLTATTLLIFHISIKKGWIEHNILIIGTFSLIGGNYIVR